MIKGIAHRKVEISKEEYEYYQELVKMCTDDKINGSDYFNDLFETDGDGIITIIKPTKDIPWTVLFFIQNLMINQHLRQYDKRILAVEKRLDGSKK